jgi:hypothetical protein
MQMPAGNLKLRPADNNNLMRVTRKRANRRKQKTQSPYFGGFGSLAHKSIDRHDVRSALGSGHWAALPPLSSAAVL